MEQKDYKEIAGIIKEFKDLNKNQQATWGINTFVNKLLVDIKQEH